MCTKLKIKKERDRVRKAKENERFLLLVIFEKVKDFLISINICKFLIFNFYPEIDFYIPNNHLIINFYNIWNKELNNLQFKFASKCDKKIELIT